MNHSLASFLPTLFLTPFRSTGLLRFTFDKAFSHDPGTGTASRNPNQIYSDNKNCKTVAIQMPNIIHIHVILFDFDLSDTERLKK